MTARRRRGLLLLSVALASGGLAASQVAERERQVEERVGPLVPVLVAARDVASGARVTARALTVRHVPARFVPPAAIGSAAEVIGARTAVPLGAGSYLTASQLEPAAGSGPGAAGSQLGPRERAVEVGVSGGGMPEALAPGTRVDVVVSTEPGAGGGVGRTLVALADVQLLALRGDPAAGAYAAAGDEPSPAPAALATLRVTLRQAVYLTAADNFGREIRLLARPPGDRSRTAAAAVSAGDL